MDTQTLIILPIIVLAALYIGRALLSRKGKQGGCDTCPQNRSRPDDYA